MTKPGVYYVSIYPSARGFVRAARAQGITIDRREVAKLLRSPQAAALVRLKAQAIATAAGEGMVVDSEMGKRRSRASVRTDTWSARYREQRDRALTRAIGAGRG